MCYGCYEEYGKPATVSQETQSAAELIEKVYAASCTGGNLHIILDDWNIEDSHLIFCKTAIEENTHKLKPEELAAERACLSALRKLTVHERASALAIYNGFLATK